MHDRDLSEWDETEIANTSFGMCTLLMGSSVFGIDAPRRGRVRSNVLSKHFFFNFLFAFDLLLRVHSRVHDPLAPLRAEGECSFRGRRPVTRGSKMSQGGSQKRTHKTGPVLGVHLRERESQCQAAPSLAQDSQDACYSILSDDQLCCWSVASPLLRKLQENKKKFRKLPGCSHRLTRQPITRLPR